MHYKIGIIGLGSIGKRHIKNLPIVLSRRNATVEIDIIRSSSSQNGEIEESVKAHIHRIYSIDDDIPLDYDVIFITNPTHKHHATIKRFISHTKHMFIEKPIFHNTHLSIDELHIKANSTYYVACPLRYTKILQYVAKQDFLRDVISARVICSSYLPEWRPQIDYRKTYSAHKSEGGGVALDLIHEWDYLTYLFGFPIKLAHFTGKFSNLEIDSEDIAVYIAQYEKFLLELHLDYFSLVPRRKIELYTNKDVISIDLLNNEINMHKTHDTIHFIEGRDDYQRAELDHFFDIIEGKIPNDNSISHAIQTLNLAMGVM